MAKKPMIDPVKILWNQGETQADFGTKNPSYAELRAEIETKRLTIITHESCIEELRAELERVTQIWKAAEQNVTRLENLVDKLQTELERVNGELAETKHQYVYNLEKNHD